MQVILQITSPRDMSGKRGKTKTLKVKADELTFYGFSAREINRLVEFEVNDIRRTNSGTKLRAFPVRGV